VKVMRDTLASLCLLALLLLLVMLAYFCWLEKDVAKDTLRDTHTTILEIGLTAKNLREASLTWNSASKEQALQTTKAMSNVSAAANQLSSFISRTDNSLNALLVPNINSAIVQENQSLLKTQGDLQENLLQLSKAISQSNKVLSDADAQITSPDIKIAMDNFATSSNNLSAATAEGAASMKDVHAALDYEIAQLEKPVKKVKVVLEFLATIAGKFLGY
jgi:hypothetical protein